MSLENSVFPQFRAANDVFLILSWRQMLLWALAFNNGLFVGYDIFILGRVQNFPSKPSLHRRRKWSRRHLRREKGQVSLGGTRNKFLTLVNMLPAICIGATFITEWVLVSAESESEFIARDQAGISTVQENGWRRPHQPRARRYRWRQTYNQDGFTAPAWQGIWRDLPQLWRALLLLGSQVRFFDVTPVTHTYVQHAVLLLNWLPIQEPSYNKTWLCKVCHKQVFDSNL